MQITEVLQAQRRIRPYLTPTPLEAAPKLGAKIWFKLENLNRTRSFKIRGALNALLALSQLERERGIVACSAGNHAQGIAYAAQLTGVLAKVVMPAYTPKRKVNGARALGADIILHGETYDDAEIHARNMESKLGMTFISPYNDRQVVAGQGTVALESFEVLPQLERVIIPTSGGGLLAGMALVCKTLNPACQVIGVQSVATPAMYNFYYGTSHPQGETLADGLSGEIESDAITLNLCRAYCDSIVLVEETSIREAIVWALRHHNWVLEGAGAVGIAAFLTGQIRPDERLTLLVLSGGNIDYEVLRGLL